MDVPNEKISEKHTQEFIKEKVTFQIHYLQYVPMSYHICTSKIRPCLDSCIISSILFTAIKLEDWKSQLENGTEVCRKGISTKKRKNKSWVGLSSTIIGSLDLSYTKLGEVRRYNFKKCSEIFFLLFIFLLNSVSYSNSKTVTVHSAKVLKINLKDKNDQKFVADLNSTQDAKKNKSTGLDFKRKILPIWAL